MPEDRSNLAGGLSALPEAARPRPFTAQEAQPPRRRDRRIDVFRGMALAMIFINHVPGTVYEGLTTRNFGFSDAAEGFVFISGTSAALAYAGGFEKPRLWPAIARIWGRAWTLYLVHLLITVWAIAIAAATLRFGGDPSLLLNDNVQLLWTDLTGMLAGLPLMSHQLGYVNILPMYTILLLACPAAILAARRSPWATLAASLGLWAAAGLWGLNLPNYPTTGGWFLNPASWQLLFVLGLLTGLALRNGSRLVPQTSVLTLLSWLMVVLALIWVKRPAFAEAGNDFMVRLADLGFPSLVRDFDKTYLAMPRLLHALAVIYLASTLRPLRRLCESRWSEPLAILGRQALAVFALGTILSFAARAARTLTDTSLEVDTAVIFGGLALLWAFAVSLERGRAAARRFA